MKLLGIVFFLTAFLFSLPRSSISGETSRPTRGCHQAFTQLQDITYRVPLFFLPGALKKAARRQGVSVLAYLQQEMESLAELKLFTHLLMGPFQQQIILEHQTPTGAGDSVSYYYLAQFRKNGHISVDSTLGNKTEFRTLLATARKKGIKVMVDFVASQIGYPGNNAREQVHYANFLFNEGVSLPSVEFMERSVAAVLNQHYPVNQELSLQEIFLATHVYFPSFGWRSRIDPEIFYPRGDISESAYRIFDHAPSGSEELRLASEEIQTRELSGLPKLYLENPKLQDYIFAGLVELTQAGVTGFRIDAARHMKFEILLALIKRMIKEVRSNGYSDQPEIFCEYWTTNLVRVSEAMSQLKAELGEDARFVSFFDHQFADKFRQSLVYGRSLGEIADYLHGRSQIGLDATRLLPVVIDHDGYRPIWDGSVDSVVKTVAGYALAFFSFHRPAFIYNSFADLKFAAPTANSHFPRYQAHQLIEEQTDVFQATNALYQYLGQYSTLFEESIPEIYRADYDELIIGRELAGERLVLRISRGEMRFKPQENYGKKTWDYYSEHTDPRGIGVEIFFSNQGARQL